MAFLDELVATISTTGQPSGEVWFRGQSDASWPLVPRLLRSKLTADQEKNMLARFRYRAVETDLPDGWAETDLRSIISVLETGSRPRGGVRGIADGVPSLGGEHVNARGGFDFSNIKYVPEEFFRSMNRGHIEVGDILVVKDGATTGKVSLVRTDFPFKQAVINEHIFRCRMAEGVMPDFVFWFFWSQEGQKRILENFQGSAQGGINQGFAEGTALPLAPLAEQRRIVAKVEELLARVNVARQRLAKVPALLKRFCQSVLAAACSGQLTADWREAHPAVEHATVLLRRLESERRAKWQARSPNRRYKGPADVEPEELPEIPLTWAWTNFDHCAWEITVGHVGPMKDRYVDDGIPLLRSQNVRPLRFDPRGLVFIKPDFHGMLRKSALQGGEILITRSGANTGDCCVFPTPASEANCADLVVTRPLSGLVPSYGAIYVASPEGQARIGLRETGMAQPHFNIGAMRVKAFPLPPNVEQSEIVRRVEALFALADKIESRVQAATARVEKITQAILAKAFRGELVPTEAELARQEGRDYEPASALLERIRAGRNGGHEAPAPRRTNRRNVAPARETLFDDVAPPKRRRAAKHTGARRR